MNTSKVLTFATVLSRIIVYNVFIKVIPNVYSCKAKVEFTMVVLMVLI